MSDRPQGDMKIVLVHPEIPGNTGTIGRTCVALNLELILIKPYGFDISEKSVRRAGLDYWHHVRLSEYADWQSFVAARAPQHNQMFFFEDYGVATVYAPEYPADAYLIFGNESQGLPPSILAGQKDRVFCLPMRGPYIRSLNLSNAVAAVVYQAMARFLS